MDDEKFSPEKEKRQLLVRFDAVMKMVKDKLLENFRLTEEYDENKVSAQEVLLEELDELVGKILSDEDERLMIKALLSDIVIVVGFPEKFIKDRAKRQTGWKANDSEGRPSYLRQGDTTSLSREVGGFEKHRFLEQLGIFFKDGYISDEDLKGIIDNYSKTRNLSEEAKILLEEIIDFYSLFRDFDEDEGEEDDEDDGGVEKLEFGDREESSVVKH